MPNEHKAFLMEDSQRDHAYAQRFQQKGCTPKAAVFRLIGLVTRPDLRLRRGSTLGSTFQRSRQRIGFPPNKRGSNRGSVALCPATPNRCHSLMKNRIQTPLAVPQSA